MFKKIITYILWSLIIPVLLCASSFGPEEQRLSIVMKGANEALDEGRISKALDLYEDFLKEYPNSAEGITYLAGIYGLNGDFQKEAELCQKAININPNLAEPYINLGNGQMGLKKWKEAEQSFLTAYKIAITHKDQDALIKAAYSLSNIYLASPKSNELDAIKWADICISHFPKEVIEGSGRSHTLYGIYESAVINKAGAYGNMKNFNTGQSILREYLKKYPESPDVMEMIQTMEEYK